MFLDEVLFIDKPSFDSDEARRRYYILRRKVIKVYPYAVIAGNKIDSLNITLRDIKSRRKRKRYTKNLQEYLEGEFEELLNEVAADPEAYTKYVEGVLKKRKDNKLSKSRIFYGAMMNYAIYGAKSPFTDKLSKAQLTSQDPETLVERLKDLKNYNHKVFYYGPRPSESVAKLVKKNHKVSSDLKDYPPRKEYTYANNYGKKVYYVDYDQVQAELMMISKGEKFDVSKSGESYVFNQYFGAGLSSIVFQEIRESKALAYSAYSFYTTPSRENDYHFVRAYIGTQADKLSNAVKAMQELMNNMPQEKSSFEQSKLGALKKIETDPITKASIYWNYQSALDKGLTENNRPETYNSIKNMTMEDMQTFFDTNIKGNEYVILVIGKRDQIDMEALSQLGDVEELELETIFGY
jgi:hypothetical protein